ncbi:MAG TPA: HDIG domain-containing protein [Solirubrobacteraceae bacterium]|jgi:putative nucleotidyltransferase with HDIG domain
MSDVLELARAALARRRAWLVGGAVRDRALGRAAPDDLDVVIDGDPGQAARALTQAARDAGRQVACFALSREFGGWRVVAPRDGWQVDFEPLRGGSLEADLLLRDFTVNAIAEPIVGGVTIDPLGGMEDLAVRRLRAAGPAAFLDDPLRVLRLVRIALELGFTPDRTTLKLACAAAGELRGVAAERAFAELARIVDCEEAVRGLSLLSEIGAMAAVLPELEALKGVEQSRFHHLDVHGHTIEVLEHAIALQRDPGAVAGVAGDALERLLSEPLADGLTRGSALRWGALLHDIAKPATREVRTDGRVTFIGHDAEGAQLAGTILRRLRASERLRSHISALVRHHLRLGFLVHEPQPLVRRTVFSYLDLTQPVEVDVTLLSIADRLATRGDRAVESIDKHMALARAVLPDALHWRAEGAPQPLLRGDALAKELGIERGPLLGALLRALAEAQYAGEVSSVQEAIVHARERLAQAAELSTQ